MKIAVKTFLVVLTTVACAGCSFVSSLGDFSDQLRLERGLGSATAPADDGLCPVGTAMRDHWEHLSKRATVGMRREQVEQLLPNYIREWPKQAPTPWCGGAAEHYDRKHEGMMYQWYYVAPDFVAVFVYDHAEPLDDVGYGPVQHLVKPVTIIHYDFTRADPNGMKGGFKPTH